VILTDLQTYVREQQRVSLAQLSIRFDVQPPALHGMLDLLARKGRVRRLDRPAQCASCSVCPDEQLEFYEWAEPAGR
jgi:Mn-dependent DtxR family transcriptional regulator